MLPTCRSPFRRLRIRYVCLLAAIATTGVAQDWVDLFNGRDLTGWVVRGGGATYTVEAGTIVGHNGPGHNTFLCTQRDYADFELELEVKLDCALNSGVQFRSAVRPEEQEGRMIERVFGPQVEIETSPGEAGYIFGERAGGWLTPADALIPHAQFIAGEWNRYRILAEGPRVRVWINGKLISDLRHEGIYAFHHRGFIGLQVHRVDEAPGTLSIAWRNLRIRDLTPAASAP